MKQAFMVLTALAVTVGLCHSQALIRVPQDQPTIQAGINAAVNGDTVLVAEGTYTENIKINKKIVLGSLFVQDGDTSHISKTIVDGSSPSHPDSASVIFVGTSTDSNTVISGFTIKAGRGTRIYDPLSGWWRSGGGVHISAGGVTARHNIISHNTMNSSEGVFGGGISMWPDPGPIMGWVIEQNQITDNSLTSTASISVGAEGAGVWVIGNGRFTHNVVARNSATGANYSQGGGMQIVGNLPTGTSSVVIANNLFRANSSQKASAILMLSVSATLQPSVTFTNNIIVENLATTGSVFDIISGQYVLINNTIANNTGGAAISLIATRGSLTFRMLNNILWNPGSSSEFSSTSNVTGSYNNIRGGLTGIGNINSDPMFMPSDSLYRLTKGSPCIGAGVISASVGGTTLNAPTVDYLGMVRPRPASSSPDLGAVEHDRSFPDPAGGVEELTIGLPTEFSLSQNFPNPFNPNTVIRYQIPSLSAVRLKIFDVLGREVATLVNEEQPAGVYQAEWDARVSSGVYFYRLEAIGKGVVMFVETKKMVLKR